MYTEDYERRGFPLRNFILKLILVIIFVFLLVWLLPKFLAPAISKNLNVNGNSCTNSTCDTSGISALTSQIFSDNIEKMKNAAISYYTDERLPKEVGQSDTMTLSDMIGKKLIIALIDKNNKACDVEKSYVKITKANDEYILKVNLKDSEKEDYILVHLGCYTYCESNICQKQDSYVETKSSKSSKVTKYVPIKGYIERGVYYPPENPTPVVPEDKHYCVKYNGKYYDHYGYVVSKEEYEKDCFQEDKHYCVKYNGKYYNHYGNVVSKEEYEKDCKPQPEKHYCVKYNGKYYDSKGNVVSKEEYEKDCKPQPEKHYCVKYNDKYYDSKGNVVSKEEYEKDCKPQPEKHYCEKYNGNYYDNKGNVVTKEEYEKDCFPEEKHYCEKYNGNYYDKKGNIVDYETYKKDCTTPDKEYIYEYKKTTGAKFSEWSLWSAWATTDCETREINCSDSDITCLAKLQLLKRKEKIGTYDKTYSKKREVVVQTGSYQAQTCSKYNYVEINKTTYATTTQTTYTQINTVTNTTSQTVGSWVYSGRASYSNPPRDDGATRYKFVGADYSYCSDTCTTLPNYYYDKYVYVGGLNSVSSTVTPGAITSSTSTSTSQTTDTSYEASCGQIVTKTVPIYSTVIATEKSVRKEPLYGDVCYKSTKSRTLISKGSTKVTWSKFNDTKLLEDGWVYTGNKKLK